MDLTDQLAQQVEAQKSKRWEQIPAVKPDEVRKAINAQMHIEYSAKIPSNLKALFETGVGVAVHSRARESAKAKKTGSKGRFFVAACRRSDGMYHLISDMPGF
jgi:hypothetical protein